MQNRQWQGRTRSVEEEEEDESESGSQETGSRLPASSGSGGGVNTGSGRSDGRSKSSVGPPPTYDGNKTPGAWEEFKVRARLWLITTPIEASSRGPRLLNALSGKAFDSMKHFAEDEQWLQSADNGDVLLREMGKPEYFGKEEIESLWGAMHRLFYSKMRRSEDDMISFKNRFEEQVRKIRKHKIDLPPEALGFVYLKQAAVDDATLERIITLTNGNLAFSAVVEAMRKLKMRMSEIGSDNPKSGTWLAENEELPLGQFLADDETENPSNPEIDPEAEVLEGALRELDGDEGLGITEDDAREILMTMIRQKYVNRPVNQMSYQQVQKAKQEFRNNRGFRDFQNRDHSAAKGLGKGKRDLNHLKSITKCRNCGVVGHWHKECPRPRNDSSNASHSSGGSQVKTNMWTVPEVTSEVPQDSWVLMDEGSPTPF